MKSAPLLKIADSVTHGPAAFHGTRIYYATADVDGPNLLEGTPVTYRKRPSRANLVAEHGDLLFAKMQATDKIIHVNGAVKNTIFSTGFFNLRPRKNCLHSRYLFWFLRSPIFQNAKDRRCTGATQKALTLKGLKEIKIPLPATIEEQKRIAAILDKADSICCKRKETIAMVDTLLRAAFLQRFGDPFTNRKALKTAPIKQFGNVVTGNTPPRKNKDNYGSAIEWIKSDNINTPNHFLTQAEEYLSETGKSVGRTAPMGSTLVTCIAGSPSVIGNSALADREVAFNQQINAVVPNKSTDSYFLYCQFLVGKKLIQDSSTNSMKGMVSKGKFQEIPFLKPNYDDQVEFGRVVQHAIKMIHQLSADYTTSQALLKTISAQAFRGRL